MSQRGKQPPSNWDAYERGRASSTGSLESVPEDEPPTLSSSADAAPYSHRENSDDDLTNLRRRRSSFQLRLNSIREMGGPNSIDNFARSFQRAAGFREITPVRRNSVSLENDDEQYQDEGPSEGLAPQHKSLLRQQLENHGPHESSAVQDAHDNNAVDEETRLLPSSNVGTVRSISASMHASLRQPSLGTSYGSISSRLTESAQRRASILIQQQHEASMRALEQPDDEYKEEPPRHVEQEVRPDGEVIERVVGESTVPMTVFNSTNVLIGVGILALPLGIKYSGWVIGLLFLSLAAVATAYTAKLLTKCLDTNTGATTYGDIAFLAFDSWGRNLVEFLFIVELTAANVALIILFSDSMNSLIPTVSILDWKLVVALGLIPLNFVAFKTLSVTSIIGIFSCLSILVIVVVDGFIKPHQPGSLREVAVTYAFPADWKTVPLSLGLFMAPWGGHSVFPAIYKDMRHPKKYGTAVKYTYIFTYGLDFAMAVVGYLMFGEGVRDEVTSNILKSSSYPQALSVIIVILIAIIPITKIPLSNRPMMDTMNKKFYIDLRQMDPKARKHSEASLKHRAGRLAIGLSCNLIQLLLAIFFPDFDSIMALMGSALCFSICIILPVSMYLTIFSSEGKEISRKERILDWFLIIVCSALALTGTVFAIIPKDKIGAK